MTSRYPYLYRFIQILAFLVVLLSALFPEQVEQSTLLVSVGLIVFLGIPHGATDHIIFQHLSRGFLGSRKLLLFYVNYLLLGGLFALTWWIAPMLALIIFLFISMYHFGQSNWNYVNNIDSRSKVLLNFIWGGFVVFAPILFHFESVEEIISLIVRQSLPSLQAGYLEGIAWSLFTLNLFFVLTLIWNEKLSIKEGLNELINLVTLTCLFFFTPTLLGFAIYFVLWHSLSSMLDQVSFLKARLRSYSLRNYVIQILPISIIVIGGLLISVIYLPVFQDSVDVGWLFVFISAITLPHIILIDMLYDEIVE